MIPKLSSLNHYNWQSEEFEYYFITDSGNRVSVLFFDCSEQFSNCLSKTSLYSLSIENLWSIADRRMNDSDNKTRNTILLILHEFFTNNQRIVLFMVLDSSDQREKARERLFYRNWYLQFGQDVCDMEPLPVIKIDSINVITYVMFPKGFENKVGILQEMTSYIKESFG